MQGSTIVHICYILKVFHSPFFVAFESPLALHMRVEAIALGRIRVGESIGKRTVTIVRIPFAIFRLPTTETRRLGARGLRIRLTRLATFAVENIIVASAFRVRPFSEIVGRSWIRRNCRAVVRIPLAILANVTALARKFDALRVLLPTCDSSRKRR